MSKNVCLRTDFLLILKKKTFTIKATHTLNKYGSISIKSRYIYLGNKEFLHFFFYLVDI